MKILATTTVRQTIAATSKGILLVFKDLCPHCKNMEKVVDKFSASHADVTILGLNIEENPTAAQELGAERPPTLFVIKNGKICASKVGLMNPRELNVFFEKA